MAILHKNISAEGDIHNPKWFSGANNGDVAWRNELGVLESTDELVLPAALDFVDGSAAPPTSNSGDIYVLSSGASVNAGWGTVSLGDWVRYDGTTWNVITPQKSSLCYNETTDALNSYDGSTWSAIGSGGGDSIYTADGTLTENRTVDLDGNDLSFEGNSGLNIDNTAVNNNKALLSLSKGMSNNTARSTYIEGLQSGVTRNYWKIFQNGSYNFNTHNGIGFYTNTNANQGTEYAQTGISAVNHPLVIRNYTNSTPRMMLYGGTTNTTGNGYLKFWNYNASLQRIQIARSGKNFINPDAVGGITDAGFIVMGDTYVGTEKISLQSSTLIKGNGTSTGSALSIYNNDTTPFKLWDFLDNGTLSKGNTLLNIGNSNSITGAVTSYAIGWNNNISGGTFGKLAIGDSNSINGTNVYTIGRYNVISASNIFQCGFNLQSGAQGAFIIGHGVYTDSSQKLVNNTANSLALGWNTTTPQHLFKSTGVNLTLPTSSTGLSSGDLWNDGGTVKIA